MTDSHDINTMPMYGIITMVASTGHYAFVTNVLNVDGDTYVDCGALQRSNGTVPEIGMWVAYEFMNDSRGPRACNARPCELSLEDRMARLLRQYGKAMLNNHSSLRLDGLTQKESKRLVRRGVISRVDYYACMSENGLKEAARYWNVEYVPGRQLEAAQAIVVAIEADEHERHARRAG